MKFYLTTVKSLARALAAGRDVIDPEGCILCYEHGVSLNVARRLARHLLAEWGGPFVLGRTAQARRRIMERG